ncbi:unnamed protein product [Adineta ricciae]|uniref:NAD(P)(+)--arginine ADP-ribosyltransferase n=1 Tax=Adineta ricciae TaxID=249248 RepID=A0A815UR88_ADIRI|nr:unnamed protein product [Adineta ricciae]CAF1521023.1 unnamed protein product [Adineta ricciae]
MMEEFVFWFYNAITDPHTNSRIPEWTKYSDAETKRTEEAFQQNKSYVLLDRCHIDLKHSIHTDLADETKQFRLKRQVGFSRQKCLLEDRFTSVPAVTTLTTMLPFSDEPKSCSSFFQAWFNTLSGKRVFMDFALCIEACAKGIEHEASLYRRANAVDDAQKMVTELRSSVGKRRREVTRLCVNFYTRNTFLFNVLNQALRMFDFSKLETLGPLYHMLRLHSRSCKEFYGTVYRGVKYTEADIEMYKQAKGTWKQFITFISTSKCRMVAEMFATNTLMIIELTHDKTRPPRFFDIYNISDFPEEDEVLLEPELCFYVIDVETVAENKYILHLKI